MFEFVGTREWRGHGSGPRGGGEDEKKRVLGADHPDTLTTADNLADSISGRKVR